MTQVYSSIGAVLPKRCCLRYTHTDFRCETIRNRFPSQNKAAKSKNVDPKLCLLYADRLIMSGCGARSGADRTGGLIFGRKGLACGGHEAVRPCSSAPPSSWTSRARAGLEQAMAQGTQAVRRQGRPGRRGGSGLG